MGETENVEIAALQEDIGGGGAGDRSNNHQRRIRDVGEEEEQSRNQSGIQRGFLIAFPGIRISNENGINFVGNVGLQNELLEWPP